MLTKTAIASCVLALCYLAAGWRNWFRGSGGPWWRRTVLTRREDLRVGAAAIACVAAVICVACAFTADYVGDGYPADKAVTVTALRPVGNGYAVAVPATQGSGPPRVAVISNLSSDPGDRIQVFPTSHGFRVKPGIGVLIAPLVFAALLSAVAAGAFVWSLLPIAGRRLVIYRDAR